MVVFQKFVENVLKNFPRRGGVVQLKVLFLSWMHFRRQGLPMELPSNSQQHFYMSLTSFGNVCGSLFAKHGREITCFFFFLFYKVTEKQDARATDM